MWGDNEKVYVSLETFNYCGPYFQGKFVSYLYVMGNVIAELDKLKVTIHNRSNFILNGV